MGGRGISAGVDSKYAMNSGSSPQRFKERRVSIGMPLIRVSSTKTNTGEMSVTYCQPSMTGRAIKAIPVHSVISPK